MLGQMERVNHQHQSRLYVGRCRTSPTQMLAIRYLTLELS